MNKTFFLLLSLVLLTFSCNTKQDKKDDTTKQAAISEPKIITMPADTVFVKSPPKIIESPRVFGSRLLYADCKNELNFDALDSFSDFRIMVSSGSVSQSKDNPKTWYVSPTGEKTYTINCAALMDTMPYQWSERFKVIQPPKPTIKFLLNEKDPSKIKWSSMNSKVSLALIIDEDFKDLMPNDVNYYASIDVFIKNYGKELYKTNTISNIKFDGKIQISLGNQFRQVVRSQTFVFVVINDIYRINFKGQHIPDNRFTQSEKTLFFMIK